MASSRDLVLRFTADTKGLQQAQAQIKKWAGDTESEIGDAGDQGGKKFSSGFSGALKGILTGGAILGLVNKIGGQISDAFSEAITQSDATDKFKQTLQFAGQSQKQIADLTKSAQDYADKTVYSLSDIQNATAQLTANGIKNSDGLVKALGNLNAVAGGNSETFKRVGSVLTQTAGAGKLTTENWNQLADAIPGASGILQKALKEAGAYTGNFRDAMAKGQITAEEFNAAIEKTGMTDVAKKAATSTKTIEGAWGNLQATLVGGLAKMITAAKPFVTDVLVGMSNAFGQLFKVVGSGIEFFQKWQGVILPLAAAFGVLAAATAAYAVQQQIVAAGGIIKAFQSLSVVTKTTAAAQWLLNAAMTANPIGLVVVAIAALVAGLVVAYKKSETFRKIVNGAFNGVKQVAGAVFDWLRSAVESVIGFVQKHWGLIKAILIGPIGLAVKAIVSNWDKITGAFTSAYNWVNGKFRKVWDTVKNVLLAPLKLGGELIAKAWGKITGSFTEAKDWVSGTWKKGWSGVKGWISDSVGKGKDLVAGNWSNIRSGFSKAKDWVGGTWKKSWSEAKDWIAHPIRSGKDAISTLLGKTGLQQVFSRAVSAMGKIWGGLKSVIAKPVKAVIDWINQHLIKGGINWLLGKLGVPKGEQIPWIPTASFDTGGYTGPGHRKKPAGLVHAGEVVWDQPAVAAVGGPAKADALRIAAKRGTLGRLLPGYDSGGIVSFRGGRFSSRFVKIIEQLAQKVRGFQLYQGGWNAGGVSASGSTHDRDAVDFGPPNRTNETIARALGMAAWLRNPATGWTMTGAHIHGVPGPTIGDGSPSARAQWQNYLDGENGLVGHGKDTGSRQYVKGGKSIVSSVFDFLKGLNPMEWLTKKVAGFESAITGFLGKHPWALGLAKVPGLILAKAGKYMQDKLFGGILASDPGGTGVDRWRGVIARALAMNGLPTSDAYVGAWLRQVASESGGNPNAVQNGYTDVNTLSGDLAKGLLQTIGATFNTYKFPGHDNIFSGFDNALAAVHYAKDRYGDSMLSVIGHGHGYDAGGMLPTGHSLVYNHTGSPERVLTEAQWRALTEQRRGPTIIVQGVVGDKMSLGRYLTKVLTDYDRANAGGPRIRARVANA